MSWTIKFDKKAKKEFKNLDRQAQTQIDKFILKLIKSANPRLFGEVLKGSLKSFWRYRIGNYRLICHLEDNTVTILVLKVGHRKDIYIQSMTDSK